MDTLGFFTKNFGVARNPSKILCFGSKPKCVPEAVKVGSANRARELRQKWLDDSCRIGGRSPAEFN